MHACMRAAMRCAAAALLVAGVAARVPAAERGAREAEAHPLLGASPGPLERSPDLLAVARVADAAAFGADLDRLLEAIAPDWTEPGLFVNRVGAFVRDPGLTHLRRDGFVEAILLNPKRYQGSSVVVAFPSEDPEAYVRSLIARGEMRERLSEPPLRHLTEQGPEGPPTDLYVAPVEAGVVVFGLDPKAVETGYQVYAQAAEGLLPDASADLEVRVHLKRLVSDMAYGADLEQGLFRLQEDLAADLAPDAQAVRDRVARILRTGLADLQTGLKQVRRAHASVRLNHGEPAAVDLRLDLSLDEGPYTAMLQAVAPRPVRLPACLPARTTSLAWSGAPDVALRRVARYAAGVLSEGLRERPGPLLSRSLAELHASVLRARPVEAVSAMVPPGDADRTRGFASVGLVRFAPPASADLAAMVSEWLDAMQALLEDETSEETPAASDDVASGPLRAALRESGVDLALRHEAAAWTDPQTGLAVDRVLVRVASAFEASPGAPLMAVPEAQQEYFLAIAGDVVLVTSGPGARALVAEVGRSLFEDAAPLREGRFGRRALETLEARARAHLPEGEVVFHAVATDPLDLIRVAAASTDGQDAALPSQTGEARRLWARALEQAPGDNPGLVTFLSTTPPDAHGLPGARVRMLFPHATLRALVRVCLEPVGGDRP